MKVDEVLFWHCFVDLDACRNIGMESGPIQPSEVEAWCRLHGLLCSQLVEDIWKVVHAVDLHRIKQSQEANKAKEKQQNHANARGRDRR